MNAMQNRRMGPRSRGGFVPRFDKQKQMQQNANKGSTEGEKKAEEAKKDMPEKKPEAQNQSQHQASPQQRKGPGGHGGMNQNQNQMNQRSGNQQNQRPPHQGNQHHMQHHHEERKQMKMDMDSKMEGDDVPQAPKKFTGRCRLFVGNLPNDTGEDEFKSMFTPFGELSEVFVNPNRGFGFVKLDTRQNAEAAKAALDGVQRKNRVLRVRFATHGAALKVKFIPSHVSNELLEEAFSQFGALERAVVIVDDRGKPTGEGIVEFARKPAAQQAILKINEGAFLLGASPRPLLVEPLDQKDEDDGYPEKFIMKNAQFHKEREQTPRFAPPGSFEFDMAQKWKEVYRMEADHKLQLQREMDQAIVRLELEQEQAVHEHQAMLLRQDLMRRQEELRKLEERQMEMAKRMEMRRQEEEVRRQEEERHRQERMMRQQQENEMRRRQMGGEGARRGGPGGPGNISDDFEMRSGNRSMSERGGRPNSFSEMRGGGGGVGVRGNMEGRGQTDFNDGGEMGGNMGSSMGGSMGNMRSRGGSERGAPPLQPPPAPPASLGIDRQRQSGMGGGNQSSMGSGVSGVGNMNRSRFEGSQSNQSGFGGNMGPRGGNMGGNNNGGNMMGGSMGQRGGPMGGNMNRRREGGPQDEYFENKRPRF